MNNSIKKITQPAIIALGKIKEKKHFTQKPIIIGACPRTGTTLLLSILSSYPQIHGIKRQTYAFTKWEKHNDQIVPERLDRLYRELVRHRISKEADRWCEKTPKNIEFIKEILDYFGDNMKFINLIRDGRDVVTSKHPKHKPDQYWVSIDRWVRDTRSGLEYQSRDNLITVRYEDIIHNFETEFSRISEFLEIDYVPSMDSWTRKTTLKRSKHWKTSVQNVHDKAIKKWQKKEHEKRMEEFYENAEAVKLLKELGYE